MRLSQRVRETRTDGAAPGHIFAILLFVLAVLLAAYLFVNSAYFAVGSVVVEGNKYVSTDEVYRIAGIPEQINIFRLNTGDIQHRLQSDLRIAEAEVTRRLPAIIYIHLKERQPLAFVASSYGFVQLDKQGVVLAAFKNLRQVNVPIITGIRLGNVYVGDQIDTAVLKNVLLYLAALDENTLNQLSEVNIKNPDQMLAYTSSSIQIRLGNSERPAEKAKLTQAILSEINEKKMAVEYIDLNFASPFIKFRQN